MKFTESNGVLEVEFTPADIKRLTEYGDYELEFGNGKELS